MNIKTEQTKNTERRKKKSFFKKNNKQKMQTYINPY